MYYDIVFEDLFKNSDITILENIFKFLKIKKLFIVKYVNNKKDYAINLPKTKIQVIPIFIVNDLSLVNNNEINLGKGQDIKKNHQVLSSKTIPFLYNPLSMTLAFDESSCKLAKQNNKAIVFNLNDFRNNYYYKNINQSQFIIKLLKKHNIDFFFGSFAKNISEIIDLKILEQFLKNFDLNENMIKKIVDFKNFEKLCIKKK